MCTKANDVIIEMELNTIVSFVETECENLKSQIIRMETLIQHYQLSINNQLAMQLEEVKKDFQNFLGDISNSIVKKE